MDKLELYSIVSGTLAQVNANFAILKDELSNKVLYRDNPSGTSNQMLDDLDMNGNHILNLPTPVNPTDPVRLMDLGSVGDNGYALPVATNGTLGGVKVGTGLTVAGDGTLSTTSVGYTLPVATTMVLGGVKAGSGVSIAGDGTLSVVSALPTVSLVTDDTLVAGSLVYIKSTGRFGLADATAEGKEAIGIVSSGVTAGATASASLVGSLVSGFSGLTPGAFYYLSTTPGSLVNLSGAPTTTGNVLLKIGTATTSTTLLFAPETPITL